MVSCAARDECLRILRSLRDSLDPEEAHAVADDALLALINDDEIAAAYAAITKWYA